MPFCSNGMPLSNIKFEIERPISISKWFTQNIESKPVATITFAFKLFLFNTR